MSERLHTMPFRRTHLQQTQHPQSDMQDYSCMYAYSCMHTYRMQMQIYMHCKVSFANKHVVHLAWQSLGMKPVLLCTHCPAHTHMHNMLYASACRDSLKYLLWSVLLVASDPQDVWHSCGYHVEKCTHLLHAPPTCTLYTFCLPDKHHVCRESLGFAL